MSLSSVRTVVLHQSVVNHLHLVQGRVAWSGCGLCELQSTGQHSLYLTDIATGRTKVVATSVYPNGTLDWFTSSGDVLVWIDIGQVLSDNNPSARWTIRACHVAHCAPWTVAGSGTHASPPPYPSAGGGHVVWASTDATAGGRATVWAYDLATRRTSVVLRSWVVPRVWLSGANLLYTGTWPPGAKVDPYRPPSTNEVFVRPLDGGSAHPLSASHHVGNPDVGGGLLSWSEPMYGDGKQLWIADATISGRGRLLLRTSTIQQLAGAGFVVNISPLAGLWVTDVADPTQRVKLASTENASAAAHFSTDGDLLAYATQQQSGSAQHSAPVVLHVVRVAVPR